jgi:hypothetical protein
VINAPVVLRTFLFNQPSLSLLIGDRVWEQRYFPIKGYTPSVGEAIVFRSRGGGGIDYSGALYTSSWVFKCYGETEAKADALYGVLVDVLHDAKTGGLYRAALEGSGQLAEEPGLGWHYILCFFETTMQVNFVPVI